MPDATEDLYALLHARDVEAVFAGAARAGATHLASIDRRELAAMRRKLRGQIAHGDGAGPGGLRAAFPLTLAGLAQAGFAEDEVIDHFVASAEYRGVCAVPQGRPGPCLEEAFASFVESSAGSGAPRPGLALGPGRERVLRLVAHEVLATLTAIVARDRDPYFVLGAPRLERSSAATWAVLPFAPHTDEPALWLYAASHARGRVLRGPTTRAVPVLLALGERPAQVADLMGAARALAVAPEHLFATAARLVELGFLAPGPGHGAPL